MEKKAVNKSNRGSIDARGELISLRKFLDDNGISRMTAWRWRKDGVLNVIEIYGRLYVTPEAIAEIKRRARNGEFSRKKAPPRKKAAHV